MGLNCMEDPLSSRSVITAPFVFLCTYGQGRGFIFPSSLPAPVVGSLVSEHAAPLFVVKSTLYFLMCTNRCLLKFVTTTNVSLSTSNFLSSKLPSPLSCLFAMLLIYVVIRDRDGVID